MPRRVQSYLKRSTPEELQEVLSLINSATWSRSLDKVERCRYLFDALSIIRSAYPTPKAPAKGRTREPQGDVLMSGIPREAQGWLCDAASLETFARSDGDLNGRLAEWASRRSHHGRAAVLVGLSNALEEIRRKLARNRTSPHATPGRADQELEVSLSTEPVLRDILEAILDYPNGRLAVYGTLAPGQGNHRLVADIPGRWEDGAVYGVLGTLGPDPAFQWRRPGRRIPVKLLCSPKMELYWRRLDQFEGPGYRRILVPVQKRRGGVIVANLYEVKIDS